MGLAVQSEPGKLDVRYVAHLARVYLTDEETAAFQAQLEQIVRHVNQMRALDLSGIEPTSHAVAVHNVFRPDAARPGLDRAQVLANAPEKNEDQFLVPRIVE